MERNFRHYHKFKKKGEKMKCDFCRKEGDWKTILRSIAFEKKDKSDIIICDKCLDYYANEEFDKIKLQD